MDQTLDLLSELSQGLWGETSQQQLIERFVTMGHGTFGFVNAGLFQFSEVGRDRGLTSLPTNFKLVRGLSPAALAALNAAFANMGAGRFNSEAGVHAYHIDGCDYSCLRLGEEHLLIWQQEGTPKLDGIALDFLSKQLQSSYVWLSRLDETQAMLYRDELTGLYNVRYLDVVLDSEVRRAQRFASQFSLLFIDMDNFKMINDKFGHLAGSSLIRQMAAELQQTSREVDSVVRFGGDEFIVLLLGASPSMALLAAERIRQTVEEGRFYLEDGNHVSMTVSIGVASFPEHAKDRESLLRLADESMYRGKRGGKNRVVLFGGETRSSDTAVASKDH